MIKKQFVFSNGEGLHARPAAQLVAAATPFKSDLSLEFKEKNVNLKSILGVMSLGVAAGSTISVIANGEDEEEAMKKLEELLRSEGAEV